MASPQTWMKQNGNPKLCIRRIKGPALLTFDFLNSGSFVNSNPFILILFSRFCVEKWISWVTLCDGEFEYEWQWQWRRFCLHKILVMFSKICFTFVNDGPLYLNNNHDPQYGQIEAKFTVPSFLCTKLIRCRMNRHPLSLALLFCVFNLYFVVVYVFSNNVCGIYTKLIRCLYFVFGYCICIFKECVFLCRGKVTEVIRCRARPPFS